jgi:D-alanyl-D-alanine carboxypeptidase (penicillin-binding protein 5/6)
MAKEAMKNPLFRNLVSTMVQVRPRTNKSEERSFFQPNRLLKEGDFFYPKATGIKTGYTKDSGYCLVASAEDKNRSLIAVILGSPSSVERYADVIELFNQAFDEEKKNKKIYDAKETKFKFKHPKAESTMDLFLENDVVIDFYPSMKPLFRTEVEYEKVDPPFYKGQKLAEVVLFMDQEKIADYPLYAATAMDLKWNLTAMRFIRLHFIALSFFFFLLNYFIYLVIKYRKNFIGLFITQKFRP